MKVALELQPCCGRRSGIGVYTYELAKRLRSENGLESYWVTQMTLLGLIRIGRNGPWVSGL